MIRVTLTPSDEGIPIYVGMPNSIDDITIEQHIALMEYEKKNMPQVMREIIKEKSDIIRKQLTEKISKKVYGNEIIPYYATVVSMLCENLPINIILGDNKIKGFSVKLIEEWYNHLMSLYANFEADESNIFVVNVNGQNETWYIEDNFMQGSTLNEFLCAAEYEERIKLLGKGDWEAVLGIMAVIIRPKGEKFDEELIEERSELFRKQKLSLALKAGFFLLKQSKKCADDLSFYLSVQNLTNSLIKA